MRCVSAPPEACRSFLWPDYSAFWHAINPESGYFGVARRDPMAMKPFYGYNFADDWAH